jgi:hypothetical protein
MRCGGSTAAEAVWRLTKENNFYYEMLIRRRCISKQTDKQAAVGKACNKS